MLAELGQWSLVWTTVFAALVAIIPLLGAQRNNEAWMRSAGSLALGHFLFCGASFVLLAIGFLRHDFSIAYVATNANSELPWYYLISAVWGGHEGSLLLWMMIQASWLLAVARFSRSLPLAFRARTLAVMGWIALGMALFTILTSNPFDRLIPAPLDGRDLNPLLQDPGLIFHPPMLYAGYVGMVVPFAFAVAALIEGRYSVQTVRWSRPWTNLAWAFLTLGITLGSWWAYYELGWGGWWFWDPVENASFMPWLVATALVHSQAVTEKRGAFKQWTLLLAIIGFGLSLLGTFLVRSGVLTSVHAFANDPERGVFILGFLLAATGVATALFAWRAPQLKDRASIGLFSRESLLLGNNLFFAVSVAVVLFGTLYPLIADALNLGEVSVGAPYFGILFTWLMAPAVVLVALAPFVRWKDAKLSVIRKPAIRAGLLALAGVGLCTLVWGYLGARASLGIAAGIWVAVGTINYLVERLRAAGGLTRVSLHQWGMALAHLGIAFFVTGVAIVETHTTQSDLAMHPGDTYEHAGYQYEFKGVETVIGPNYRSQMGTLEVTRNGKHVATMTPEKRRYNASGQVMTQTALDPGFTRDLYVALGEPLGEGNWSMRVHHKPLIRWIWLGALMMMAGAVIAAADRRYRREMRTPDEQGLDEAAI
jgi:cytochrome c-type biogenesis protein CcmF